MPPVAELSISISALPSPARLASNPVDPTDDHHLMLAVRDGDLDQLGELFERHHGRLYGFFVNLTGHRALSEDLVQIVFERILKYRHTYRDEENFSAWLYHMARKAVATHYRKKSPEITDPVALHQHAAEGPAPDHRAAARHAIPLLRPPFSPLPTTQ